MKLWMIITFAGHIGASVGPLPIDLQECHKQQIAIETEWDQNWEKKNLDNSPNNRIVDGKKLRRQDIKTHCVWWNERPKMDLNRFVTK